MQTANIMLDIGGDAGNQVPKRGVTAAEIAVLIAIHGESAVHDINPAGDVAKVNLGEGDVKWTNRVELQRLRARYSKPDAEGNDRSPVGTLFPGAAARVYETIDELGLPDEFFKPLTRAGRAATFAETLVAPVEEIEPPVEIDDAGVDNLEAAPAETSVSAEITPPPAAAETDSLFQ